MKTPAKKPWNTKKSVWAESEDGCSQQDPFEVIPCKPKVAFEVPYDWFDSASTAEIFSGQPFFLYCCNFAWRTRNRAFYSLDSLTTKVSTIGKNCCWQKSSRGFDVVECIVQCITAIRIAQEMGHNDDKSCYFLSSQWKLWSRIHIFYAA